MRDAELVEALRNWEGIELQGSYDEYLEIEDNGAKELLRLAADRIEQLSDEVAPVVYYQSL